MPESSGQNGNIKLDLMVAAIFFKNLFSFTSLIFSTKAGFCNLLNHASDPSRFEGA